ncbi:MAG: alanyl-tRNA editing protein [Candidatus Thermoplasmatota archaeon]|nr:alanyl-tRNA editing protein [Candidatus Thermoplasmatota archaeon]
MDPMYLNDIEACYVRTLSAKVIEVGNDGKNYFILDRTVMYPLGGGQPSDTGIVFWNGGHIEIDEVRQKGPIFHYTMEEPPPVGTQVTVNIDWDKRYRHMRMHTAQHIMSSIIWKRYRARTVGNQIHTNRSHIDFCPLYLSLDDLKDIEVEVNETIQRGHKVNVVLRDRSFFENLEDIKRIDMDRVPKNITKLRSIEIGENGYIDRCPCAGTHIKNTSEIGLIKIIEKRSKGKERTRVEYTLEKSNL